MGQLKSKIKKQEFEYMQPTLKEMKVKDKDIEQIIFFKEGLWKTGKFKKVKELGSGASCKVHSVKVNGGKSALKEMSRDDEFNPSSFVKEIAILHMLKGHNNILQYEAGFLDKEFYYIQTGLLEGGELFDRIRDMQKFSEKMASKHVLYILDAIHHSHRHQIVHRDLKPENMVYTTKKGPANCLKIIDFGDAKYIEDHKTYEEFVGTAFYLPPEIIRKRKGKEMKKSDVWSIGVITYVLLTGRPPFWGNSNKEILRRIIKGKVQFPKNCKLSATAKHFILNLVQKRIEKRYDIPNALKHPFIVNHNPKASKEVLQRYGIK